MAITRTKGGANATVTREDVDHAIITHWWILRKYHFQWDSHKVNCQMDAAWQCPFTEMVNRERLILKTLFKLRKGGYSF